MVEKDPGVLVNQDRNNGSFNDDLLSTYYMVGEKKGERRQVFSELRQV